MECRETIFLLFVCFPLLTLGYFHDGFTHHIVLDSTDKYFLYWKVGATGIDDIEFEVQARTKGWVGLGFSSNGAMTGSDIVIVWIDTNGQPHISDRHGPTRGNGFPPEDAQQNYEIVAARENETHTIVRFKRKQSTCDANDWQITKDTVRIIWAFSDQKPNSPGDIHQHSTDTRGVRSVYLLYNQTKNRAQEVYHQPGIKTFDIFANKVRIPHDSKSFYWCQIFEVPKFTRKHHLVGYEMLVQSGHEKYAHHLLLYGCRTNMSEYLDEAQACFGRFDFYPTKICSDMLSGWAVGGEPFAYPDGMASPWFGDEFDYILGEFHYENSDFRNDIVDNSGIRLYFTEALRPIETGRFTIGRIVDSRQMIIPPNQQSFTIYSYCPAQCTANLQDEPMTIFSGVLHTHLLGVKVRLRQIRNGVELGDILVDNHYDFNYQTSTILDNHPKILPGDDLILECEYNSKGKNESTFSGKRTTDEMCVAFLEYYPKRQAMSEGCFGSADGESLIKLLGAKHVRYTEEAENTTVINAKGQNQTFMDLVENLQWDANSSISQQGIAENLEKFGRDQPHIIYCFIYPRRTNYSMTSNVTMLLQKNPTIAVYSDRTNPVCKAASSSGRAKTTAVLLLLAVMIRAVTQCM